MPRPNPMYNVSSRFSEYFSQPLYDTVNYAAIGQAVATFFAIPLGQAAVLTTQVGGAPAAGTIKTKRDTNMETAGFIADRSWEIGALNLAFLRHSILITDVLDRQLVQNNAWLDFQIGSKHVLDLPIINIPLVNPYVATTWGALQIAGQVGTPIFVIKTPLGVESGQTIRITLETPGAVPVTTTFDIKLTLYCNMEKRA